MNCWEILGIDPTRDRTAIDRAYEQQKKFADGEDLDRLKRAYQEASGEQAEAEETPPADQPAASAAATQLTAQERQIVREVVIQVKALLNDSRRSGEAGIWRAILAEPPADQAPIRAAVGKALEQQVRPMAENGAFPAPVVAFLGDWFGWNELQQAARPAPTVQDSGQDADTRENIADDDSQQPVTNFWPAVVGWVVALAVLAAFFDSIFGA